MIKLNFGSKNRKMVKPKLFVAKNGKMVKTKFSLVKMQNFATKNRKMVNPKYFVNVLFNNKKRLKRYIYIYKFKQIFPWFEKTQKSSKLIKFKLYTF